VGQQEVMDRYDLCLAWNWEYDADFVTLLDAVCQSHRLSLLQITPENVAEISDALTRDQIACRVFWDRASEDDARFIPIVQWAADHCAYRINPAEKARLTWDKAAMHRAFINLGLYTPYTIILPPYEEQPEIPSVDWEALGERFTIKPAHGGGGEGVVVKATSLSQIQGARQEYPGDRYLLQTHVRPIRLESRAAWFRVFYCAGQIYLCWWDTNTHVNTSVTPVEETSNDLDPLRPITTAIAQFCGLDLFSTEIALTLNGRFVVVDYINDQIDLRLQSKAADGVPDDLVRHIAESIIGLVETGHRIIS
jgi:glutathione synthase/RimK-type ligase-like ATP-grasp enzyme